MNYEAPLSRARLDDTVVVDDVPARRRRGWIVAAAILLVVAIGVAAWLAFGSDTVEPAKGKGAAATAQGQAPVVTVAMPGRDLVQRVVSATGQLAARRDMPVGVVGEGGEVARVLVEPGQWVADGQVLATIDRSVQRQQVEQQTAQIEVARADLKLAQAELERAQALVGRGFISQADIDRRTATRDAARARVNVAQAQLAELRARVGRLDVRAPAAGLVLTRNVEPGQVVGGGSGVLFRIAMGGRMEMLARLAEGDLALTGVGAQAQVTPVGGEESVAGEVWQVSPVVDPQTRQGIARIAIPYNDNLRPGGFASARIVTGARQAPLLPESAVLSDGSGNYVFIVRPDDTVERRAVVVGEVSDAGVAINSGLSGSEHVVLTAGAFLNPGDKVRPVRQTAQAAQSAPAR